jgi:hypothetical protein
MRPPIVERTLAAIDKVQVQAEIGLDFPHSPRPILRQDPDIIMIGEICDLETARIVIQSSLIGHLVLSTLDINSAAATISRHWSRVLSARVDLQRCGCATASPKALSSPRHRHNRTEYYANELARTVRDVETYGRPNILRARG